MDADQFLLDFLSSWYVPIPPIIAIDFAVQAGYNEQDVRASLWWLIDSHQIELTINRCIWRKR